MSTGRFHIMWKSQRRLMPLAALASLIIGIVTAIWLLNFWLFLWGIAGCIAFVCAFPKRSDRLGYAISKAPNLNVIHQLSREVELHRSISLVAGELASFIDLAECQKAFSAVLRRYWSFEECHCLLWERGQWQSLSKDLEIDEDRIKGFGIDELSAPITLPRDKDGLVIIDLSPSVSGRALVLLTKSEQQPTLQGLSEKSIHNKLELLRVQFALSLRRAIIHRDLQALARIDPLTEVDRRWYGEQRLQEGLQTGHLLLAMLDIDHFKNINDTYGHLVGDQVLKRVGTTLRRNLRPNDLVFRYGGEEFVVVLKLDSLNQGQQAIARLLREIAQQSKGGPMVTLSAGLIKTEAGECAETAMKRADEACYLAKSQGRNRVQVVWPAAPKD